MNGRGGDRIIDTTTHQSERGALRRDLGLAGGRIVEQ